MTGHRGPGPNLIGAPDQLLRAAAVGVAPSSPGWDQAIDRQTVGSELLLVIPPGSTLVFVVDILGTP